MVDWKLCIDSPQKRAFDFCYGSLTEGNGFGSGFGFGNGSGYGCGYGGVWGDGYGKGTGVGAGYGNYNGLGGSPEEWK